MKINRLNGFDFAPGQPAIAGGVAMEHPEKHPRIHDPFPLTESAPRGRGRAFLFAAPFDRRPDGHGRIRGRRIRKGPRVERRVERYHHGRPGAAGAPITPPRSHKLGRREGFLRHEGGSEKAHLCNGPLLGVGLEREPAPALLRGSPDRVPAPRGHRYPRQPKRPSGIRGTLLLRYPSAASWND